MPGFLMDKPVDFPPYPRAITQIGKSRYKSKYYVQITQFIHVQSLIFWRVIAQNSTCNSSDFGDV